MHTNSNLLQKVTLLLLVLTLTACANKSPDCSQAGQPPVMPSLPMEARQHNPLPECLPNCSTNLSGAIKSWQKRLIEAE